MLTCIPITFKYVNVFFLETRFSSSNHQNQDIDTDTSLHLIFRPSSSIMCHPGIVLPCSRMFHAQPVLSLIQLLFFFFFLRMVFRNQELETKYADYDWNITIPRPSQWKELWNRFCMHSCVCVHADTRVCICTHVHV